MQNTSNHPYNVLCKGFHLKSADVNLEDKDRRRLLQSTNVWEVLAGILLSSQSGDFSELPRIPALMRQYDDWLFWKAATELVGYAGSWRFINQVFTSFQNEIGDRGIQYFLPIALSNACGLWIVEPLLMFHAAAVDEDIRYQIENRLSYIFEKENDLIWFGAEEENIVLDNDDLDVRTIVDFESYAAEVHAVRDEVVKRIGSKDLPVFEGELLDITKTAERLYHRIISNDEAQGRIDRERMLFEAATGIDCSSFYDENGIFQSLSAAAVMETFLESNSVSLFKPGQRYFFGFPIDG